MFSVRGCEDLGQVKRYKAKIANKEFTIVGQQTATHMKLVVDLVNERLSHLEELTPGMSLEDRAILLAINAVSDQVNAETKILNTESKAEISDE